jgi:hypothetical protein
MARDLASPPADQIDAHADPADAPGDPTMERDEHLPPTLWELARRLGSRVLVGAFALSLVLHLGAGLISMFVRFGSGGSPGLRASGGGAVEMAISGETSLERGVSVAAEFALPTAPEDVSSNAALPEAPLTESGGLEAPDLSIGSDSAGALLGGGDIGSNAGGLGIGSGSGGGASFFGVESSGTRIAFVVDISASMEGPKFERLKRELRTSLDGMGDSAQVFLVGFSDGATVIGDRQDWVSASPLAKRRLFDAINALQLGPSTKPLPGFQLVFRLRPKPDAIYFMTDGEFDEAVVEEVALLNRAGSPVPIHTIAFVSTAGEDLMKRIASMSKGTYTYVAGP